jgi:phospholipid/cholesterol/gamma-HCH transport system ATP-binding protein
LLRVTAAPATTTYEPIVVEHVSKRFGDRDVLADVSFSAPRSKTTVILGGSGAGKTTLLRLLIGLDRPTTGKILIDGEDIVPLRDVALNKIRRKFGMVFQYAALLDSLTVFENVAFPLREHTRLTGNEMRERVREKLSVLGLENTAELYPSQLSGGMRKRVGLARALMLNPEIVIYDEPTSGLDPTTSRMVDDLIEETRERFHVTNVVISHDMASTFRIAHQAFLLSNGRIVASGTPDEIATGENAEAKRFLDASGVAFERLSRPPET